MTRRVQLLPRLPVPVLRTACLARQAAWFEETAAFRVVQRVPGVVAVLRLEGVALQLWQVPDCVPQTCRIAAGGMPGGVFACHARIARRGRACLSGPPALQPWGDWEFDLTDSESNRLVFTQWAGTLALPAPEGGAAGRLPGCAGPRQEKAP